MLTISNHCVLSKRDGNYIVKELNSHELFCISPPASIVIDALTKGVTEEEIKTELARKLKIASADEVFQEIVSQLKENQIVIESECSTKRKEYVSTTGECTQYINKASLIITDSCTFQCVHCYNDGHYKVRRNPLTLEEWKCVILDLKKMGCISIMITGGEPFLSSILFELLDYIEELGMAFCINTNGTQITTEVVTKLKKYVFLEEITISVYGFYEETMLRMCGKKVNFNKILSVHRWLNEANISNKLKFVFTSQNYDDAKELCKYEKAFGIRFDKRYTFIYSTLNGEERGNYNLTQKQLQELLSLECVEICDNQSPCFHCGGERCAINFLGEVSLCEKFQGISAGNIHNNSLCNIWKEPTITNLYGASNESGERCSKCTYKEYCQRCDGLSYVETGTPFGCSKSLLKTAKDLACAKEHFML